jgi:hypothetical protein
MMQMSNVEAIWCNCDAAAGHVASNGHAKWMRHTHTHTHLIEVDVDLDPLSVGVVNHCPHRREFCCVDDEVPRSVVPAECACGVVRAA